MRAHTVKGSDYKDVCLGRCRNVPSPCGRKPCRWPNRSLTVRPTVQSRSCSPSPGFCVTA